MNSATRYVVVMVLAAAAWLGPGAQPSEAQQPLRVEGIYPRQLPIGQTTVVSLVVPSADDIQADVAPSTGAAVSRITRGETFQGAHTWWDVTVVLSADAAPGERTLTVRLPGGRSAATSVVIPPHVPRITDLRVVGVRANPAAVDLEISAADASGDLGSTPSVWFIADCGAMPLPGVVRGKATAADGGGSVIRASMPRPLLGRGADATATCNVRAWVADSGGFESNRLSAVLTVPASDPGGRETPSPQAPVSRADAEREGGEWVEIVSQEERFTALFPGQPAIEETTWFSQFGAVLPARVYSMRKGQSRYSVTAVDYTPVEPLLVERSRSCPEGANTCQGIADWGVGYWKTDIRGALLYVVSKALERDVKVTSLIWNGIALVQGVEVRVINNADQSRTFTSIYMHENRLIVVEATVPRGDPPPVAFGESLNWLDAQGRPVRYQSTYVNIPDVPKPLPRGAPAPPAR